jgi:hypothetical protein
MEAMAKVYQPQRRSAAACRFSNPPGRILCNGRIGQKTNKSATFKNEKPYADWLAWQLVFQ